MEQVCCIRKMGLGCCSKSLLEHSSCDERDERERGGFRSKRLEQRHIRSFHRHCHNHRKRWW